MSVGVKLDRGRDVGVESLEDISQVIHPSGLVESMADEGDERMREVVTHPLREWGETREKFWIVPREKK